MYNIQHINTTWMCKSIIYVPLIELVLLALWYYFASDVYHVKVSSHFAGAENIV